jgi:nucleotide-binding universal stress UspA family protein
VVPLSWARTWTSVAPASPRRTPARSSLTEVAEAADLLVVGSRGRTGWSSLLLGSVGLRCITYAPCPVAVVRPSRPDG